MKIKFGPYMVRLMREGWLGVNCQTEVLGWVWNVGYERVLLWNWLVSDVLTVEL